MSHSTFLGGGDTTYPEELVSGDFQKKTICWPAILQSSVPLGTAKYLIRDMIFPGSGAMYFCSMNVMIFFCNTSFSSGFSGGCRCLEVGPFEENMTLTPHFACKRNHAGKRKKIRCEPVGYSNQSLPAEHHRITCIALASLFPADPLMRALVVHASPCSCLRKDRASRQSFNRYNRNANPQRMERGHSYVAHVRRRYVSTVPRTFTLMSKSALSKTLK